MTCPVATAPRRILLAVLLAAAPATGLAAQKGDDPPKWKVDPFTKNDPEAMKKAGYVSFGPIPWGEGHGTAQIEHILGEEVKLIWVETAHFRIGSALESWKIPRTKKDIRKKIADELKALKKKLPKIKTGARELSPWLRLHLYAHRLEELYADFQKRMGVTDADFPQKKGALINKKYMGEGPYLGQPDKFGVLLFAKKTTCGHYLRNFLKMPAPEWAIRHNFLDQGSLLYVTCAEFAEGRMANDTAMHCEMAFNILHGFIDGYRYYRYSVPHWFRQGLAHWYLRNVHPEFPVFNEYVRFDNDPERLWNWPPRVRARVRHGVYPKAEEILVWKHEDEKTLVDTMMLWSRIDYLMSLGDEKFRVFLDMMKSVPSTGYSPTDKEIAKHQLVAMKKAWGLDPESFDKQWSAWVMKTYPKK